MTFGRLGILGQMSTLGTSTPAGAVIRIAAPSITSPADDATDIGETPTITTGAFAVTNDGSDTHASTDWQIASDSDFSTIVVQSLADASNKVSWAVPSGNLSTSTEYFIRARHNGTTYGASGWSSAVSFTTASAFGYSWTNTEGEAFETSASETGWDDDLRGDIDQLISDLKSGQVNSSNVYGGFDRIVLMDLPNQSDSLRYLNAPTLTAAAINSPTFAAGQGFTGGGTKYINTNFNFSTDGTQFTRNSASMAVWVRDVGSAETAYYCGAGFGSQAEIGRAASGSSAWLARGLNGGVIAVSTQTDSAVGLLGLNRSGSAANEAYVNGTSDATDTDASKALENLDCHILSRNTGSAGNHSDGQVSIWFVGRSFTANEWADIYDAFNRYRTAREAA